MGKKQEKIDGFEKIMKPMNYDPKYLKNKDGSPNKEKYIVEDKEDGLRGFIFVFPKGRDKSVIMVTAYTSGGVCIPNASYICADISTKGIALFKKHTHGFVLDGEFTCDNWNNSNSAVKTQTFDKELAEDLSFRVWDLVPAPAWHKRKCVAEQDIRKKWLWDIYKLINSRKIIYQPYKEFNWLEDQHVQVELKQAINRGAEGIVIKDYYGLYEFKKCKTWMKLKPYLEADMTIIGAEEECDKHGKPKNSLGALVVKGIINGKKIKTNVGGGYKRKDRIDLWKLHKKNKLVGKVVEMKHEGVTVNNAVRFPRFKRMRDDKVKAGNNK